MKNQDSQLTIFSFNQSKVRTVLIGGKFWFVAKDLCNVLGIQNTSDSLIKLRDKQKDVIGLSDNMGRNQRTVIVSEEGMYRLVLRSRKKEAEEFQAWVEDEVLPSIRRTGQYSITQNLKIEPQKVTDTTIETHTNAIQMFSDSGDLQLAQLLKSRLGNLILAEQQHLFPSAKTQPLEIEQYEGAIDVAIRLGFSVPSNFEGSLGNHVKHQCGYLLIGKNIRYSNSSGKQIPANMYPAYCSEVEDAVRNYCVGKAFKHREINLIDS